MAGYEQRVRVSTALRFVGEHILASAGRTRRTTLLLMVVTLVVFGLASPALAAPGDLDTTFGNEGLVRKPLNEGVMQRIAVQSDGKIVTAGARDHETGPGDLVLTRYTPNGSLDSSFDGDGSAVVADFGWAPEVFDIAIQPDGKIVVGGTSDYRCSPECFILARFTSGGALDTTFSDDGKLSTPMGSWASSVNALAIQSDGKIIAAGTAIADESPGDDNNYDFALARYNSDGSLDTTFDGDGKLFTPMGSSVESGVKALSVQPDGKVFAVGLGGGLAIAHYNSDGSLDTTFSDDGKLTTKANLYEQVNGVGNGGLLNLEEFRFQPDGKIVLGGLVFGEDIYGKGYNYDFGLARYNADGSPDTTFDGDGKVSTDLGTYSDQIKALVLQPDGKIVAGGWSYHEATGNSRLALARYAANGILDTAFSSDGIAFGMIDSVRALALQPDGKILATGTYFDMWSDAGTEFALTRHYGGDDATAPGPVTAFRGSVQGNQVSLSWTNPTDSDFEVTRVLRSTTGYATSATQTTGQRKVYEGTATTYTNTVATDVHYYYSAFARDNNGNWSVAAKAPADMLPPETTIRNAPTPVANLPVRFSFESSEAGSTFECRIDNEAFSSCTSPQEYPEEYPTLSDGPHTFYVQATDAAGNTDPSPDTFEWTVDTQGPVTTIDSGPSGTVSAGSARFRFSSEPGAAFFCQLDDGGEYPCQSAKEYTGLSNGQHTFSVRADDDAGNRGLTVSRTWTIAPETVSEPVAAGGTLTSDTEGDGATASDPVETQITSPVAGTVEVTESATVTESSAGYSLLGQQVTIHTPDATAENPLRFVFTLDSTLIPAGEDQNTIQIFRNGAQVQNCADQSGTASPDPCVLSRVLVGDDIQFTILTSHASEWNFGVDDIAPTVTVAPRDLATGVSPTANVTATFSEAMKKAALNNKTFFLVKKGTTKKVPATLKYPSANKVILDPSSPLTRGATYTATITRGAKDLAGNALAAKMVWSFKVSR